MEAEKLNILIKPVFERPETYLSDKKIESIRKFLVEMTTKFNAYSNARFSGKITQCQHIDERQTILELNEVLNLIEDARSELSEFSYYF